MIIKKVILLFLILNISVFAKCFQLPSPRELNTCPSTEGYIPLGNTYTPTGIFLGHEQHGDSDNANYLERFIGKIRDIDKNIVINILVSKKVFNGPKSKSFENIILNNKDNLNLIPINDEMPSWIQDPIEFLYKPKKNKVTVLGLPYDRSMNIYKDIAKFCEFEAIKSPVSNTQGGNHGGNIDHLYSNNIMIGDSSSDELNAFFKKENMNVITVSTDWLNVGHADEVILPLPGNKSCPLQVAYASPLKALELLSDKKNKGCSKILQRNLSKLGFSTKEDCLSVIKASKIYEAKILESVDRIKSLDKCIKSIEFPVIFFPKKLHKNTYGLRDDQARSILPNPINSIVLNKSLITPFQLFPIFENYINKVLHQNGLNAKYIKNKSVHWSGGNVHCTSNILRACK